MAKCCLVSGTKRLVGCNVSHAHNRTKRVFLPNIHKFTLYSEILKRKISLDLTPKGRKTIDKYGGFDGFLANIPFRKLAKPLHILKKQLIALKVSA